MSAHATSHTLHERGKKMKKKLNIQFIILKGSKHIYKKNYIKMKKKLNILFIILKGSKSIYKRII